MSGNVTLGTLFEYMYLSNVSAKSHKGFDKNVAYSRLSDSRNGKIIKRHARKKGLKPRSLPQVLSRFSVPRPLRISFSGGDSYIKMTGVLVVPFRGLKCGFGTF